MVRVTQTSIYAVLGSKATRQSFGVVCATSSASFIKAQIHNYKSIGDLMTFHDIRFPEDIAFGSSGGPEYSTDVVITHGGYEQRNINWAEARARYNVAHGVKTQVQLDALLAFFRARKGKAFSFRFKDWTDFNATGQAIGVGDGVVTQFQLIKTYVSGATIETRMITKPVNGAVNIFVDAVLQTETTDYTLDYVTGIITFLTAPANSASITADFDFDVPARFDTDRLSASLDTYGSRSWNDIPLLEVRG